MRDTRQRLPDIHESITAKNNIGNLKFYVTVGFYPHTAIPGEVFIHIAKNGSTLGGVCSTIALALSIGLQHGAPWEDLSAHMRHMSFEPSGTNAMGEHYPSLAHAIAVTVDRILEARARDCDRRSLNEPSDEARSQSPDELTDPRSNPSHVSGE